MSTDLSVNSDHYAIIFSISAEKPVPKKHEFNYRKWKSINLNTIQSDITSAFNGFSCDNTNELQSAVGTYNSKLIESPG